MIIMIIRTIATETNGVSFSLVAGACCGVKFSNTVKGGSPTLNINSTGAKSLNSAWTWSVVTNLGGGSMQQLTYMNHTLVVYNGSMYLACGQQSPTTYYTDAD